ncbi:hypothetical protein ANN_19898 [Periplaneta americana]|uniref:THAP-type domain-containing protein n=1 Tax=Periplaneta americana TaxID=6978 RepID=A0ABQ8SC97_PERAM|nr:hypothetical protein ANN_19898 [Periplaneta americana]
MSPKSNAESYPAIQLRVVELRKKLRQNPTRTCNLVLFAEAEFGITTGSSRRAASSLQLDARQFAASLPAPRYAGVRAARGRNDGVVPLFLNGFQNVACMMYGKELRQPSFYRGASRSRWGKSGCDVGKRTVPVRKYDSILKALSSLENANIFLSVLLTICGLGSVWSWNFLSRRGGSEVHSKTQEGFGTQIGCLSADDDSKGLGLRLLRLMKWDLALLVTDAGWPTCQNQIHECHSGHLPDLDNYLTLTFYNITIFGEMKRSRGFAIDYLAFALWLGKTSGKNPTRRLRWAGHVARMGESRNAYRVLVGRLEGKRPLGRPRRRWEDNIKMDLREVGYDDRDWINLAQDRDRWRAYVRAAMNLRFKVCNGSLYAVIRLVDEPREFNLPTLPQRCITYVSEKLPASTAFILKSTYRYVRYAGSGRNVNCLETSRICSLHFEETSYEVPLKQKLLNYEPKSSRNLKVDAVPTKALAQSCLKRKSTDNLRLNRCEKRRRRKEIHDIIAK